MPTETGECSEFLSSFILALAVRAIAYIEVNKLSPHEPGYIDDNRSGKAKTICKLKIIIMNKQVKLSQQKNLHCLA